MKEAQKEKLQKVETALIKAKMPPTKLIYFPLLFIAISFAYCAPAAHSGETPSRIYRGGVSQNELVDNLERLGIKCIIHEGAAKKLVVSTVRLGSNAYYQGVAEGDAIKSLVNKNGMFELSIDRAGKTYQLSLRPLSAETAAVTQTQLAGKVAEKIANVATEKNTLPIVDVGVKPPLVGEVPKQEQDKKLIVYDIEVILDITGSMDVIDGTKDLTKFQWCHEQVKALAQRLAPYHKKFAITTFNERYETVDRCDPAKIEQLYNTIKPSGNTDLVDPLMNRCEVCLGRMRQSGKPQLIVIISDGLPNVPRDPKAVNRALVEFTQRLSAKGEVTITFLQIGDNFDGRDFCVDLDENLVNEGARFDMVHTTTFAELKNEGIIEVLVEAIRDNVNQSTPADRHLKRFVKSLPHSDAADKSNATLQEKRRERKQLEEEPLQNTQ